ncbi:MAG TPA: leucyl aminopeptidase [Jatrophihabitans sp.]|nr:leucyl aminopeptidase [Jatrophihabitans sp.]
MASVHLVDQRAALSADVLVVGTLATDSGAVPAPGAQVVDEALGGQLTAALTALEATGKPDEVCRIPTLGRTRPPLVLATGLGRGTPEALAPEAVRRAVGAALRAVDKARRVAVAIGDGTDPDLAGAVSDGALLGNYRFTRFKSGTDGTQLRRVDIVVTEPGNAKARAALRRSAVVTEAVNNTRDLVNTPANHVNPPWLADYARQRAEAAGMTVEVLDERALRRGGYGAILAVGGGSATPPRLVRLSHRPANPRASVALVGKGITFDSGGLDIKHVDMAAMKSDMGGAAAVIESAIAAAKLKLPVAVTATVPLAENVISGTSYRPSDVLRMRNGSTVEVGNTDAEGRLILADAISRACEDRPDYLIETSTLTGGQVIALGQHMAGAMGSEVFRDWVASIAAEVGESIWPMPLGPELRRRLDSPVADIVNVTGDKWASMLIGGTFLADFVTDGVEWVHLDIAGPSFRDTPTGYYPVGATGYIVRTILGALDGLAAR